MDKKDLQRIAKLKLSKLGKKQKSKKISDVYENAYERIHGKQKDN